MSTAMHQLSLAGQRAHRRWLIIFALVTIAGWQHELGRLLLYPFTLFATYAHEMGHGLTAELIGGTFHDIKLYPNGAGLAASSGDFGRIGRAMVSLGGLVGPSIAGSTVLMLSRRPHRARLVLYAFAALMLLSVVLYTRNLFGIIFVAACAALTGAIAHFAPKVAPFFLQFLGVQLCLALFRDVSYMFSEGGTIDGVQHRSDSAAVAEALFLPYWFWGALAAAFSIAVLALGIYVALRPTSPRSRPAS